VTDAIVLSGLRVLAIVGVLETERVTPQVVVLDLTVERDFAAAAAADEITATTDYAAVLALAERVVVEGRFLLLETLVTRVADAVLALDDAISAVTVCAAKATSPVPQEVASVGVRTTRRRA